MGARRRGLGGMDAALTADRRDDGRAHRLVPVVADAHLNAIVEVDPFNPLKKTMDEMLA